MVGIISVPLTSTALFLNSDSVHQEGVSVEGIREQALSDRRKLRAQRRLYWQAIEQFQNARRAGDEDAAKPDINALYPGAPAKTEEKNTDSDESVPDEEPTVSSLSTRDLQPQDRLLLRRYTRAGSCPEGLKDFRIPGFYDLCTSIVGEGVSRKPVVGFLNHNAHLRQSLRPAADVSPMKMRLLMLQQALESNKRDSGRMPMRPSVCKANPRCQQIRDGNWKRLEFYD